MDTHAQAVKDALEAYRKSVIDLIAKHKVELADAVAKQAFADEADMDALKAQIDASLADLVPPPLTEPSNR